MIQKFLTMLVVLMMLIPSVIAAPNENANPKAGLKIVDQSKGTMKEIKDDKVKGIKSSSIDIIVDEKGKNSIKLKDSKPSKVPNEHKKVKVSIPASELQKIDVDNDGVFGVLETTDEDVVIGQYTATSAQLAAGIEFTFSEVEVNGYSGYKSTTFNNVKSNDVLTFPTASDAVVTMSVAGTIPASVEMNSSSATFPRSANLMDAWTFENSKVSVRGRTPTGTPTYYTFHGDTGAYGADLTVAYDSSMYIPNNNNYTLIYSFVPRIEINSTSATNDMMSRISGNSGFFTSFRNGIGALASYTYNGTGVNSLYATPSAWNTNTEYGYAYTYNPVARTVYINGTQNTIEKEAYNSVVPNSTMTLFQNKASSPYVLQMALYNESLTVSEIQHYYVGASGLSLKPNTGYNWTHYDVATTVEKTVLTDGTATTYRYINTASASATHTVTLRAYYTEDTTISTQSSDNDFHNISIVHNAGNTVTNGTIIMPIAPLYTGTAVLDSNNTNAVITQNRTHFTIYTGTLTAADWFGYNVSVPNNADHGMWLDRLMQWVAGVGWNFVGTAPTDYTDDISNEITVTVS